MRELRCLRRNVRARGLPTRCRLRHKIDDGVRCRLAHPIGQNRFAAILSLHQSHHPLTKVVLDVPDVKEILT